MSIKKSLRLSLLLLACLPLVFLTILTYIISYNKYFDLAKESAIELAKNYGQGFESALKSQIAEVEGLSYASNIQNIALESYNDVSLGKNSPYYKSVTELLENTSELSDYTINYYIYDINGYFLTSSSDQPAVDWQEYMAEPVASITTTMVLKSSKIDKTSDSIEIVCPIMVKETIVGLIRANIQSTYFGAFIPNDGSAFILTSEGDYLFSADGLSNSPNLEKTIKKKLDESAQAGHLATNTIKNIYGYCNISDFGWMYLIQQKGTQYQQILSTLPITLLITLIIITSVTLVVSRVLTKKYTDPILTLKDNMTEASNGNLDSKCEINTNDEFGDLSHMFNNMMDIISNNYKELAASKNALELSEQELKKNYDHIEQLAYHDGLTGLYNRVAFMKFSTEIFESVNLSTGRHAVFFIDLDNFKNVNDTLGHDYGDLLLQQVSDKMASCLNEGDILARNGGDEFLIMKNVFQTKDDLENFAKKLVDIVHHPFQLDDETANVSMSVGIAIFPKNGLTISELIKNSDIAMYNAKNAGKNSYRFFDSYMEDDVNRKNDLVEILNHVIEKNEVFLQYQPQVNVTTGQVTGYEALMRIQSEVAGYISPVEFIPIAEESGVINDLGKWALIEACTFNQRLIEKGLGPLRVSVNVSTMQLKDVHLIDTIKSIPEKTGMDLHHLEIEITESVLMNSFEHNLKLINQMKDLGCSIALDDFGTGYSSFNYLTQIPIDTLKIDKSFIDGICYNEKDKCIADSIINLAHKMKISVVAEGVENTGQLSILQSQFCDTLQGYLFSKPLKAEDMIELLESKKTL